MSHHADPRPPDPETYSPWTIVNLVFGHLVDQGLHPILGGAGDPGAPAAALLRALGIAASAEGDARVSQRVHAELAELRARMLGGPGGPGGLDGP